MSEKHPLTDPLLKENPLTLNVLGVCAALAITNSLTSSLIMSVSLTLVLMLSNAAISAVRQLLPSSVRLIVQITVIAAAVTSVELAMAAWWPGLHASLGIFLPLIVTNCLVLARAEAFASRQPVGNALLDGFAMGGGFLVVLVVLGSVREMLGRGSLGGDLHALLGTGGPMSGLHLFGEQHGFLLALLPPGAFILLGLGLAWRQARQAAAS
mgnify:CR=1 FL=1